jgi:hypothetical protein
LGLGGARFATWLTVGVCVCVSIRRRPSGHHHHHCEVETTGEDNARSWFPRAKSQPDKKSIKKNFSITFDYQIIKPGFFW